MGTGGGKQKKQEETYRKQQDAAIQQVRTPSEYEKHQQPLDLAFLKDLNSGKDVRDIDSLRWNLNLFDNAQKDPAEVAGAGLMGDNALVGANQNVMGMIGKQLQARQQQQAQGDLYNSVQNTRAETHGRLGQFADAEQARNMGFANMSSNRYTAYLNRPKQPSFWEKLALGGVNAAGQLGSAAITAGMF
jgi:hypothetical protein